MLADWQLKFNSTGFQLDDDAYNFNQLVALMEQHKAFYTTSHNLCLVVTIFLRATLITTTLATTTIQFTTVTQITTITVSNHTTHNAVLFKETSNTAGSHPTPQTTVLRPTSPTSLVRSFHQTPIRQTQPTLAPIVHHLAPLPLAYALLAQLQNHSPNNTPPFSNNNRETCNLHAFHDNSHGINSQEFESHGNDSHCQHNNMYHHDDNQNDYGPPQQDNSFFGDHKDTYLT